MAKELLDKAYIRALRRLLEEAEAKGFTYMRREECNFREKILEEVFRGDPSISLSAAARALHVSRETLRNIYQSNGLTLDEWKEKVLEEK